MVLKVRDSLLLHQRMIGGQENRPDPRLREVSWLDVSGQVGIVLDKVADNSVQLHHLVVPGRDGHLGDVDEGAREGRPGGQRTRRGREVGRDGVAEAAVLVARVGRSRREEVAALAVAIGTSIVAREVLVRVGVRLRVELGSVGAISAVAEASSRGSPVKVRRLDRTRDRTRNGAGAVHGVHRGRPKARLSWGWGSPVAESTIVGHGRRGTGRQSMRSKARRSHRRRTARLETGRRTMRLHREVAKDLRETLGVSRVSLVTTLGAQRHDGLVDDILVGTGVGDGLNDAGHGVGAGVLHDPEGSSAVDLILEMLDGVFKLLQRSQLLRCELKAWTTYLDHSITVGRLRLGVLGAALLLLERLELTSEVLQLLHDLGNLGLSLLALTLLVGQLDTEVTDSVVLIVGFGLCEVGLDAHARDGLVRVLGIERQVHERVNELARLGADDLSDLLELRDDLVGLLGGDARHAAEGRLDLDENLLRGAGLCKSRLQRVQNLCATVGVGMKERNLRDCWSSA